MLIERGLARSDPFKLGLDVTRECAVIDADGSASGKLFAVGPLTRGTFFEIDAFRTSACNARHSRKRSLPLERVHSLSSGRTRLRRSAVS